tara:strand:+ start:2127 stop:2891 length:765 start_codon:yes stop_codon:yes gene_type:complete
MEKDSYKDRPLKNILVIGESCLDVFHYGDCTRLCPDAPVPVFKSVETKENGGMAMNVFNNIKAINNNVNIITNENWRSIKKIRFVELKTNHMFMRLDENDDSYAQASLNVDDISDYDAVVVSDYDKGFLTKELMTKIASQHPLTFLDTKKKLGQWCSDFTFIKINGVEYERTKDTIDRYLYDKLIVTQGQNGCIYRGKRYTVPLVEVKDVSGAGDTFISGLCCKYLETDDIESSIKFANYCATSVVQKRGVSIL